MILDIALIAALTATAYYTGSMVPVVGLAIFATLAILNGRSVIYGGR